MVPNKHYVVISNGPDGYVKKRYRSWRRVKYLMIDLDNEQIPAWAWEIVGMSWRLVGRTKAGYQREADRHIKTIDSDLGKPGYPVVLL